MLFSSTTFLLLFLPVILLGYHGPLRFSRKAQNLFLLLGSLFFYAWGEPWFVLLMLLSIGVNFGLGLWADKLHRQHWITNDAVKVAFLFNLGLLFIFKYLNFVLDNLALLGDVQPLLPVIRLPIGISFFTFQALSYVLDVASGKADVQKNPLDMALYISFFPQLIAGPIVKYADIAHQIHHRKDTWTGFSAGVTRFALGLSKKVLLSNQLAVVADRAFGLETLPAAYAWLGAACYTLQIYYDFSGYSDMAIGLGQMFGFQFRENFNYPYVSTSITEFWRRWHISLSSWFRDYVYIPLGGSRTGNTVKNLFVVWLFTGIWHGANWTFLVWGLFYFCLLYLEKFRGLGRGWPRGLRWVFTLLMVNFAWVFFRAESLSAGWDYLLAMFGSHGWASAQAGLFLRENAVVLLCSVVFMFPTVPWLRTKTESWAAKATRTVDKTETYTDTETYEVTETVDVPAPSAPAKTGKSGKKHKHKHKHAQPAAAPRTVKETRTVQRTRSVQRTRTVQVTHTTPLLKAAEILWAVIFSLGITVLVLACMCYLVKGTYNPFIYFNF